MMWIAVFLTGCGVAGDPGGPRILRFAFNGQLPPDPQMAVFSLTFSADDGTLGAGNVTISSGGSQSSLALAGLFSGAGLPLTATSGEIGVPIGFSSGGGAQSGDVEVTAQLIDSKRRRSNTVTTTVHVEL